MKKLFGFRSNTLWKKIVASLYYIFCIISIFISITNVPPINANIYDMSIYKSSTFLMSLSFIIPVLLLSNFSIKNKIPLLKKKKWWSSILGSFVIFVLIALSSQAINLLHSNDYTKRYEDYLNSQVNITYNELDPDFIPKGEESTLTDKELEDNLEDLINSEDNNNANSNNNSTVNDKPSTDNSNTSTSNNITNNNNETNTNNNNPNVNENPPTVVEKQLMTVHYIDVGQGDSIFIELPNKRTMLIDAGESSKGKIVSNYISSLGYTKIDYLVGTHPHSDHIGGMAHIINTFSIGSIYMPKAISTSKTYENLLNTISQKELSVFTTKVGVNILNEQDLKINIIAPNSDSYSDLNDYSAVIKITYGNNKFLFMGDAEVKSENEIKNDVSADVIKIGHHGSDTSSGQNFVNKVNAKYVIISVGVNNRYNHPYQSTIDRWSNIGAKIFRTDLNGNIIVSSNGSKINIATSR